MKKIFSFILALVASVGTMFASIEVGGIWYDFDSSTKIATVTNPPFLYEYSGYVIIPAFVRYKNVTYNVTSIGYGAFKGCTGLTSVTIPISVTSFEDKAFWGCSGLTNVTIPNSVTSIGDYAFYNCSGLTSVTIPNSVTSIGYGAFEGCTGLTSVTIPTSVTIIINYAFYGCTGLTSVTIPNSVCIIEDYAFAGCTGLTSVSIGNSVTDIGWYAFGYCSGLTSITCNAYMPPSCKHDAFEDVNTSIPVYVPGSCVKAYKAAEVWKKFFVILPIENIQGVELCHDGVQQNTNKVIKDGQILILSGDKTYTLTGQEMR